MEMNFGVQDLYEASIKATSNMKVFGQEYQPDEVVMFFDKVQISELMGNQTRIEATGGKGNFSLVAWENVKGLSYTLEYGVVSKTGFGFLTRSEFVDSGLHELTIPKREKKTSNEDGVVELDREASTQRAIFVYKIENDIIVEKITDFNVVGNSIYLPIGYEFSSILVDYYFNQLDVSMYEIGGERLKGFFKLSSKMYFVDEKEGTRQTVLFVMPKVSVSSNFSLILGKKADPIVSMFRITAHPDTDGKTLGRFFFLGEDVEGSLL